MAATFCAGMVATPAFAEGDAEAGRDVAVTHCSRCHVIPDHDIHGGIGSTPSFELLASFDDWEDRFASFYARRPHPVFVRLEGVPPPDMLPNAAPFELTQQDIDDIVAFGRVIRAREQD